MNGLVLGVDLGTASTKAVLARADGSIVAQAGRSHQVTYPHQGWAEVDAEGVLWREVASLCQELLEQAAPQPVEAICVSGMGPCLVLCDEDLKPVRPAILYGIDMRAEAEIEELSRRYGLSEIMESGGSALSSQAVGPKLLWVQRHEHQAWRRAVGMYSVHSYVAAKLTGAYVLDHHTASQYDPMYRMGSEDWHPQWAAELADGMELPSLSWPGDVVGTVTGEAAALTGLKVGIPVCAGTVDAWAEGYSVGAHRPGDLMLMYGSTMFFVQVVHEPDPHPLLWTTKGVDRHTSTLAAGMSTSGILTDWIDGLTGRVGFAALAEEAATVPPGSDGLVMLPYFAGERTPVFDPDARGVIAGLRLQHGRGHLFRAAYEGIACGVRQIIELFDQAGGSPDRVFAVGGGTKGGLWTQVVSDVSQRPQLLAREVIGACYGDALLAARAAGLVPDDAHWAEVATVVEPNLENIAVYDEIFGVYSTLYGQTKASVHRLARLQR